MPLTSIFFSLSSTRKDQNFRHQFSPLSKNQSMGVSWSNTTTTNTRRNTTWSQQNPSPPPPPLPYDSNEPIPLTPLPPQNNSTTTTSTSLITPPTTTTTTTGSSSSYPPPQSSYCTPPPPFNPYYPSHPYNSRGYTNYVMGRFSYHQQPYFYANQGNQWWPTSRPGVVGPTLPQNVEPAPYVEHQNAKKIRNDVNVHKDTLKVEVDVNNPDHHLVSFVFDALLDGSITILYFGKEESNCRFIPLFPEATFPVRIPFQKGHGQKFCQPSGTGIDLGFFELDDLAKPSPEDVFPLVIVAETFSPGNATPKDVDTSGSNALNHMQITQAVLEKKADDSFLVKVIKQILWVDGVRYELCEIFGMESSSAEGFDDSDPGKECVICMTEPKDTIVLPCRHMCLCGECGKALRLQSNQCPICRQPIEKLVEIKINGDE